MTHRSCFRRILCGLLILCMLLFAGAFVSCTQNEPIMNGATYRFVCGNVTVFVNDDAATVLDALGAWKQYSESPSCLFDGLDKVYVYGGFRIQTYPQNGGEFVYSIELLDDSVATPEGIMIGSSRDAVLEKYGEGAKETATAMIYTDASGGTELMFSFRDGKVTNIQYKKIVENG